MPSKLLQTKQAIRVGMSVEDAERAMGREPPRRFEFDSDTGARLAQAKGFSGYLYEIDPGGSVQCEGWLVVDVRDGRVTRARVFLYNDLDHSTQEVK